MVCSMGAWGQDLTISSDVELVRFAQSVSEGTDYSGKTIVLKTDIVVNTEWNPMIGNEENPFNGTFDGGGNTIGIKISGNSNANYQGLFGCVGEEGTVKNLILADSYITGGNCVGGIVGRNYGKVLNCSNISKIIDLTYGNGCIGGIVGENYGEVSNCSNSCRVVTESEGTTSIGGIVGQNSNGTVSNCSNSGEVIGGIWRFCWRHCGEYQ